MTDIAYHYNKYQRGFTNVYNLWGPDHHGYIKRLEAAIQSLECLQEKNQLNILIVQQVNIIEQGKIITMSKRLGRFHTLRDLLEKIPVDILRYFFISRSINQHLDFNIHSALDTSNQNPVYYIQYAYARIHSIFQEYQKLGLVPDDIPRLNDIFFKQAERNLLLVHILRFRDELHSIGETFEVHLLTTYLYKLAHYFTKFYHHKENHIIQLASTNHEDKKEEAQFLTYACFLTMRVFQQGFKILGISAPEKM